MAVIKILFFPGGAAALERLAERKSSYSCRRGACLFTRLIRATHADILVTSRRDTTARIKREVLQPPKPPRGRPPRLGPSARNQPAPLPRRQYLLRGNPLGQNLVSLRQRGQNFIFPVHEWSPAVQSSESGIRRDCREPSADSGGRGAQSLGPPEETSRCKARVQVFPAPAPSTSLHFWEERLAAGRKPQWRGCNSEAGWLAGCLLAAPSLQNWSESLRDSPACYSQRGGRAKSGWKHFSKVLTQTCSDSVFDMSDISVHDLRKTRTVNHIYWHNLHLFAGRTDRDTTTQQRFKRKIKNQNLKYCDCKYNQIVKRLLFLVFN